jgi:tRNA 5-methylaminomethyl-2-thiouridine biosynthesis bifunctional protein
VVLAAGWGNAALLPDLNLSPVRGQADWVETAPDLAPQAIAWGGYVAPTGDGFLFGATHDRDEVDTAVRDTDSERNRTQLAERLPALAERANAAGRSGARAAVRAATRDRLPVCGPVPDAEGLFVLGGLGSRGFCVAPLLGEHLAATLIGAPSPLPADLARRVLPDRFQT